jgi:hypothetical protein
MTKSVVLFGQKLSYSLPRSYEARMAVCFQFSLGQLAFFGPFSVGVINLLGLYSRFVGHQSAIGSQTSAITRMPRIRADPRHLLPHFKRLINWATIDRYWNVDYRHTADNLRDIPAQKHHGIPVCIDPCFQSLNDIPDPHP